MEKQSGIERTLNSRIIRNTKPVLLINLVLAVVISLFVELSVPYIIVAVTTGIIIFFLNYLIIKTSYFKKWSTHVFLVFFVTVYVISSGIIFPDKSFPEFLLHPLQFVSIVFTVMSLIVFIFKDRIVNFLNQNIT